MGNKQSQDSSSVAQPIYSNAQTLSPSKDDKVNIIADNFERVGRQQQLPPKSRLRTSSHRGYRPRSASLRRIRSIQKNRLLDKSNARSGHPAGKTARMEADDKKLQEEKSLLAACSRGDLKRIEKLVDSGVDVNSSDSSNMTALHYAAMHARDDVIKSLISRGAEVNTADMKGGSSAMHWVVNNSVPKYGSIEGSLTALSKAGCNMNTTDFNFATPLHIAAQKGNRDGVQVLLRLGADPDKTDITGRNCFQVAKNEQTKHYMKILHGMSSKKDHQRDIRHNHQVLNVSPTTVLSSKKENQPEMKHTYHVLEALPPTIPAPLLHVPPPRLVSTGKSSPEDHIYSIPEFHTPPSSPSNFSSGSISPSHSPPYRRHCQYPLNDTESGLYNMLEHFPRKKYIHPSPPRRRKVRRH